MTRYVALLFLTLLIGYGMIKVFPLVSGPSIRIASPLPFASTENGQVTLEGQALRANTLTLNGGSLLIDEAGRFATTLTLPQGSAILSLTADDRFGRSITKRLTVYTP